MQNINPSNNVNRRGRFYGVMGLLVFLGGLIACALGILFFVLPLLGEELSTPAGICLNVLGVPIALGGMGLIIRAMTLQKDNPYAYEVGEALKRTSIGGDARYTFIRNLSRRQIGYIDAVLVGPPGVLVFRTVNYRGAWINERVDWRNRTSKGLKLASTNPTRECARDVYALRKYFAKRGLEKVPVYGMVVFTAPDEAVDLQADAPVIPVAELHTLFQIMRMDYLQDERIDHSIIRRSVDALID
jgi:hypothetical protein